MKRKKKKKRKRRNPVKKVYRHEERKCEVQWWKT